GVVGAWGASRGEPRDFQGGAAVGDARHRSGRHSRPARQGCVLDAGPDVGAFAAAVVRAHVLLRRGALIAVAQARRGAAGARAANRAVGTVRLRSLADNQRDTLDRTVQCRNGLSEGSPISRLTSRTRGRRATFTSAKSSTICAGWAGTSICLHPSRRARAALGARSSASSSTRRS